MSQLITLFTCESCDQVFEEPTDMIQANLCVECYEDCGIVIMTMSDWLESECNS